MHGRVNKRLRHSFSPSKTVRENIRFRVRIFEAITALKVWQAIPFMKPSNSNRYLDFQMELSSFAESSFSAVQWLNSILDPLEPSEAVIESTAHEVSFKLQLFIHQLSLSLHDTAYHVS